MAMYPDTPGELFFVVIVSGGTGSGVFIYSPSFAPGNLIVSITAGTTGPLGETGLLPGITNYQEVGASPALTVQILNGVISFLDQQSIDAPVKNANIGILHQPAAGLHPIMGIDGPADNASGNQAIIWLRGSATGDDNSQVILFNGLSNATFQAIIGGSLQFATISGGLAVAQNTLSLGAANEFTFDHPLIALAAAAGNLAYETLVTGDTNNRWSVDSTGTMLWGSGSGAADCELQRQSANLLRVALADFAVTAVGRGFRAREGANCKQGTATLSAGTILVANTSVTANSRIFLTAQDNSSTGTLRVSARTAGTSFTITSSNAGDSGVVAYEIFEPG